MALLNYDYKHTFNKMLYPLLFHPVLKTDSWAGSRLQQTFKTKAPISESWEVSSLENASSIVANGMFEGNTLEEMVEIFMGELVGDAAYARFGLTFPLIIKLIDAGEVTPVYVNPDDRTAQEYHGSYGREELWYVTDCDEGAVIYAGFKVDVNIEDYASALLNGDILPLLESYPVRRGDAIYIPSCVPYAIGKEVTVAAIQQTSDILYKVGAVSDEELEEQVFDARLIPDSIEFPGARLSVIRMPSAKDESVVLVKNQCFAVNRLEVTSGIKREYPGLDSFIIYLCVEGSFTVTDEAGQSALIEKGHAVMLAAEMNAATINGRGTLLEIFIGEAAQ